MLLLKIIQKLIATLNSDGTPGQVAAGIALGSAFGLTPFASLHNLVIFGAVFLFNVSFPAAMLGWVIFAPVGFLLDPLFDTIGRMLLVDSPNLVPMWTALYNMPVVPLSNYNNTVVLGSFLGWVVLLVPIFFFARWGVGAYRQHVLPRLEKMKFIRAMKASKLYNVYQWFQAG